MNELNILNYFFPRISAPVTEGLVSALRSAFLVSGQGFCDKKENETTAISRLLERLELKSALVTIDAMGTQDDMAEAITAEGPIVFWPEGRQEIAVRRSRFVL